MRLMKFAGLLTASVLFFTGASVWEGSAAAVATGDLPGGGYSVATNSFPRNSVIDITNLENGRTVRVIVVADLKTSGLLATLSRSSAEAIGLSGDSVCRIRMTQPSDDIAFSRYRQGPLPSATAEADVGPQGSLPLALPPTLSGILSSSIITSGAATGEPSPAVTAAAVPTAPVPATAAPATAAPAPAVTTPAVPASAVTTPAVTPAATAPAPAAPTARVTSPAVTTAPTTPTPAVTTPAVPAAATPAPTAPATAAPVTVVTVTVPAATTSATSPAPTVTVTGTAVAEPATKAQGIPAALTADAVQEQPTTQATATPPAQQTDSTAAGVASELEKIIMMVNAEERIPEGEQAVLSPDQMIAPLNGIVYYVPNEYTYRPETVAAGNGTAGNAANPAPETANTTPAGNGLSHFTVPVINGMETGMWYVQVGAFSNPKSVENEIDRIGTAYPTVIQIAGSESNPVYRVLLGPLSQGESGAMLQRFKSIGYKDAFIRTN